MISGPSSEFDEKLLGVIQEIQERCLPEGIKKKSIIYSEKIWSFTVEFTDGRALEVIVREI